MTYPSGTWTWNPDGADILIEAWEMLGRNPEEMTGTIAKSAMRSAMLMFQTWANKGINLWQVDSQSFHTVAGKVEYMTADNTIDVLNVIVTDGTGTDYVLSAISRGDYVALPAKLTPGRPTQYWCERILPNPVLHLYPAPDQVYTVTYWRYRQTQDFLMMAQQPEAPLLWMDAIAAGIAARLAVKYAPDKYPLLMAIANQTFTDAAGENRERVPFIAKPLVV